MQPANINQTRFDKLGAAQKFGAELRDVFKLDTPKPVSVSTDTALRRGSASALGERLVETRLKSSPNSLEKRYSVRSATLGNRDHEDRREREAPRGEWEPDNQSVSESGISRNKLEARSKDKSLARRSQDLAGSDEQPAPLHEDGNGRGKEIRDSGAENSGPHGSQPKNSESLSSMVVSEQDGLAAETVIPEGPASPPPTASPLLVNGLSNTLSGGNLKAIQLTPPSEAEKEVLRTQEVADSATKVFPDLVETAENRTVTVTKLYGDAVERSSELPLAFTLNFEPDSVRPANSQLLHLRNHLALNMATPQEAMALDQSQILQSGAASSLLGPKDLSLTSISLDALRRHATQLKEREAPSALSPRIVTGCLEQGEAAVFGVFSSITEKGSFPGQLPKSDATQPVEQTGAVSDVPATKRPVSQLILKFGGESDSSVSVRLNSRNAGLIMDVLGGDQQLRDSLRGSLSYLEKALERHALDSGWKAIGSVPPAESLPFQKEATSGSPYDANPNHRNGSRGRQDGQAPHGGGAEGESNDERRKGGGNRLRNGSNVDLFSLGAAGSSSI